MENNSTKKISSNYTLNNGLKMPRIGLGTYAIENIGEIVYQSIKDGVRLIDTAYIYENESVIGAAIKKAIDDKLVTRPELFIVTKLPTTWRHKSNEIILKQLKNLGLDYVDLYLDHWPYGESLDEQNNKNYKALHILWAELEGLVEKGFAKSIGVSNYNVQLLMDLLIYAKIKPVVNQFELHPYLPQKNLVKYCLDNKVAITAYNSLSKGKYVDAYHGKQKEEKNLDLLSEPIVKELSEKYKVGAGNIALNWALAQDINVIPSTANPSRMKENLKSLEFNLSKEDLEKLDSLNINYRFNSPLQYPFGQGIDIFA